MSVLDRILDFLRPRPEPTAEPLDFLRPRPEPPPVEHRDGYDFRVDFLPYQQFLAALGLAHMDAVTRDTSNHTVEISQAVEWVAEQVWAFAVDHPDALFFTRIQDGSAGSLYPLIRVTWYQRNVGSGTVCKPEGFVPAWPE